MIANVAITVAGLLPMALALSMFMAVTKIFHVALGASYTIAAYLMFTTCQTWKFPALFGWSVGILGAVAVGHATHRLIYVPLQQRGAANSYLLLAALACYSMAEAIVRLVWGAGSYSLPRDGPLARVNLLGASLTREHLVQLALGLGCVIAALLFLHRTRYGLATRAVMSNPELARLYDIDVKRVMMITMVATSSLAAVAGISAVYVSDVTPAMGLSILLAATAASVIGGIGSPAGVIFGCIAVAFVEQATAVAVGNEWKSIAVALFAIAMFFLLPNGIVSIWAVRGR